MNEDNGFVVKNGVLMDCPSDMDEIAIPEGVRSIHKRAMHHLSHADVLHLPSTLERLPRNFSARVGYPERMTVAADNPFFAVVDGVLFSKDMRTLLLYPCSKEEKSYTVPDGVERLAPYCFYDNHALRTLKLPDSLKVIGEEAISCNWRLKSVHIPRNVRRIDGGFLWMCGKVGSITIDPKNKAFFVQDNVLFSKDGKTLLRYMEAKAAERYDIPQSVEVIADGAFCSARRLKYVTIPDSVKTLGCAFWNSGIKEIFIPDSITEIPEGCFADCNHLERIRLPKDLTRLEGYLFDGCTRLKEMNIPRGVNFFGTNTLLGAALTHVSVPEGTKSLGWNAFANMYQLRSVTLPSTLERLEGPVFWMTGIRALTLPDGFQTLGHASFSASKLRSIRIPCGVTRIPEECFNMCAQLTHVDLPHGITRVEAKAFADCPKLKELTFSEACRYIAPDAFERCPLLTIRAPRDSYAYRYAKRQGIPVKDVKIQTL